MKTLQTIPIRREMPAAIRRLAIVVREDAFDRLLTPLTFAWEMSRQGAQVDMLFMHWAVRVLTKEGVRSVQMDPAHADREPWLRERLVRMGNPVRIHDYLKLIRATGHGRLHACRDAAQLFEVRPEDLVPEVESIIDPGRFLNFVAMRADHVQYF